MSDRVSRRRLLQVASAGAGASVAGCLGVGGGSGGPSRVCAEELPAPHRGDPDAAVTVMAFEDYACGACQSYVLDYLPGVLEEYVEPGEIRYEHHDFPVSATGPESWPAASAARAVQDEVGLEAFWTYSRRLYEEQSSLGLDLYADLAEEVDADPEVIRSAAEDRCYEPVVEADQARGEELGVGGTPTVFVNGSPVDGYSTQAISDAIDNAMAFSGVE